jgi:hypothetical protein
VQIDCYRPLGLARVAGAFFDASAGCRRLDQAKEKQALKRVDVADLN